MIKRDGVKGRGQFENNLKEVGGLDNPVRFMGNFYVNYTLRGPTQKAVAAALKGRSAIVTRAENGCVIVFDEESDEQNQEVIAALGSRLSEELGCPVLAVMNHDDDILWYHLYLNGELADEYDSNPAYFDDEAEPAGPAGGDAHALCAAFGRSNEEEVGKILRKSTLDEDDEEAYTFAIERHSDLVRALGLPEFAVGGGFSYINDRELPEGLSEDDLMRVS